MYFEQFHFLRPDWLLVFLPLIILLWLMLIRKLGSKNWEAYCDQALLPHILLDTEKTSRRRSPIFLIALCGSLAIVALAGPAWNKLPQPVFSKHSALVIALDLSRSMDANDISPSRVARARFKIADILKQRKEGLTALEVYAGDAFTVTPLTDDTATINSQLNALTTDIMPAQGNRTDLALKKAGELLRHAGVSEGDILLMTDEVDFERSKDVAKILYKEGYRISVLGIGTEQGVPVPLDDGSFLKDRKGQIVIPILDEKPMQQLAATSGGRYVRMSLDDNDIDQIQNFIMSANHKDEPSQTELKTDVWREQGPWLLILLMPFAALAFRRGYLLLLLAVVLPLPRPAQAFDWQDLWLRSDQQAARALDAGDQKRAAGLFKDPAWKGVAEYRAGDYGASARSLDGVDDLESLYNKGNALARTGQYQQAIAAYDKVLELNPDHEDASFNKKLLEDELKKQQEQQQQDQDKKNQQQQQKKDGNGQAQDEQQQNKDEQSQSAKRNPDQQQGQDEQQRSEQKDSNDNNTAQKEQYAEDQISKPKNSEPQSADEQQQPAVAEQQNQEGEDNQDNNEQSAIASSDEKPDEEEQASEQWLRRIPDDPAGLLRRKFRYQYQQREQNQEPAEQTW